MLGIFKNLDNRKIWTLTLFLYVGLGGLAVQVRGPLMSNIQSTFSVSKTLLGIIAPSATLGFATAALVTGMFAGKIHVRRALLLGVGLAAIMSILIGFAPMYYIFLGFMIIRGIASGVPGGLCRPLLGHLYPESRGKIFNINEAIWAVGAAAGPIFASFVLMFGTWRLVYILLGFLFLPVIFFLLMTEFSRDQFSEKPISLGDLGEMVKHPILIGILFGLFFDVGVEGGFFTWLPYYLEGTFSKNVASLTLSGFLAAYIPGRLFNGWLSEKFEHYQLVLLNSGAVTFLLVLAFFFLSGYLMIGVILGIGFFISGVFPNLFTWGVELFPEHSGPINGLVMTVDPLGLSIIPVFMGAIADSFSMDVAMQFMVLPMIGVVIITLGLRAISRE